MSQNSNQPINIDEVQPYFSLSGFLLIVMAAFASALTAVLVLPYWLPGLSESITGVDAKVFWYLSRGSAFSAYFLLWLSMILGVGITNKLAALWPGLPPTIELHQYTSILGLFFGLFHGLILLGDNYINFKFVQILVPFFTTSYKPASVGLGQLGFYLWVIIALSFYVRKRIKRKAWRAIHFISFVTYGFVLVHGILSGTNSSEPWAQMIYFISGAILFILIVYRVLRTIALSLEKNVKMQNPNK